MNQVASNSASELERTRRYLASDPGNPLLLARAIDLCLAAGQIEEAGHYAEEARRAHPGDAQLANRRGHVLLTQGKWHEAAALFGSLLAQHPDANIAYSLALAEYRLEQFAPARDRLQPFVNDVDAPPQLVTLYLRALHQLGDVPRALEVIYGHMTACGSDAEFLGVASLLAFDGDQRDEAARLSSAALASGRRPIEALIVSGSVALAAGDLRSASELFDEVLATQPTEARSWAGLGAASLLAGNAAAAKEQLERAAMYAPTLVGVLQLLSWCHIALGDLREARRILDAALAQDDKLAGIHGAMAACCALMGDKAAAQVSIERAMQLDANELSVRYARVALSGAKPDVENLRLAASQVLSARAWRPRT
jgi:predicted Zn-dependent protease